MVRVWIQVLGCSEQGLALNLGCWASGVEVVGFRMCNLERRFNMVYSV